MFKLYSKFIGSDCEFERAKSGNAAYLKRKAKELAQDYKAWCAKYGQGEDRQIFIIKYGTRVSWEAII